MADDPVYISVSVRWGAKVLKNNVVVSVGPSDTFYGLLLQQLPEEYTIGKGWSSRALIPPPPLAECRHALAERTTSGQPTALKFTMRGEAPRSLSVSVADMGPDGVGDALVSDDDVVLLYNGHDHYNGLVASSVAEGLA